MSRVAHPELSRIMAADPFLACGNVRGHAGVE